MKKDNLEQFIAENRDAFDDAVPNLKVWANIDKQLNPTATKRRTLFQYINKIAAAVLLLMIMGAGIHFYNNSQKNSIESLSEISKEFGEMEKYYEQEVNRKLTQLAAYKPQSNPVTEDLQQLDEVMEELKQEYAKAPSQGEEIIINAIIKNYQTRLMILERVLDRVESVNQKKKKDNGTINI